MVPNDEARLALDREDRLTDCYEEIKWLRSKNYRLGWALEEIVQSADLDDTEHGKPDHWYCISTHLIDSARKALTEG